MKANPFDLDPMDQIHRMLAAAPRALTFKPGDDFSAWRPAFADRLDALLGPAPPSVDLDFVEESSVVEMAGASQIAMRHRRIVYRTDAFSSSLAHVYEPKSVEWNGRTIVLCHGHDPRKNGVLKHFVGGRWKRPYMGHIDEPVAHLVKSGFSVLAPIWRGFKERALPFEYHGLFRDPCNVMNLAIGYFGYSLLAFALSDARRSIDLLDHLGEGFSSDRLGVVGKSFGGTVSALLAATDTRIRAAVVSGYLSTIGGALSGEMANTCGSQMIPDLLNWGDIPDIFGLIAPRPLLIEAGINDPIFAFADATVAYEQVATIYEAAGARNFLERDTADVGHDYIFAKAIPFLFGHL